MSRAVRVIDFLASLKGMDHLQRAVGDTGAGAIDLWTANVITPAPDDEEGEVLSLERADGQRFIVNTHKLAETLMLRHARELLRVPSRSIVVLVSDFEEGGSVSALVSEARALVDAGAKVLGLAALDERRAPRYHRGIARQLVDVGVPIAALSPLELAGWVRDVMRGETR